MDDSIKVLGQREGEATATVESKENTDLQITKLEAQITMLTALLKKQESSKPKVIEGETTKDGVPINMCLVGISRKNDFPYILITKEDGYYIGNTKYNSLSAAAEAVSGCRRSGWTFWKTVDKQTLKEALGK